MQTQLAMRELSLDEIEAVSGAGAWADFWKAVGDALLGASNAAQNVAAIAVEAIDVDVRVRYTDPDGNTYVYSLDCPSGVSAHYVGEASNGAPIYQCGT